MIYSTEVKNMCPVTQGVHHGAAPIPEEAKWVQAKKIEDISGYTHGIGWCAPQQGCCKLSLNVKDGVIQEALVETLGCSGMIFPQYLQILNPLRTSSTPDTVIFSPTMSLSPKLISRSVAFLTNSYPKENSSLSIS